MGNSGSQAAGAGQQPPRRGWAHSYPRPVHKVLPERVPGQRLRLTTNGNILHSGGTLTGRKYSDHQLRPRSASQGDQYEPTKVLYGSEPDLRFTGRDFQSYNDNSPAKLRISRSRKKYKAPPAPHNSNGMDSSSPDSYQHWEMTGEMAPPVRRLRLFKTKAESSKRRGEENHPPHLPPPPAHLHPHHPSIPPPGPLQRSHSSPQFQVVSPAELLEAAERLRPVREPPVGKAADSPVLRSRENFRELRESDKPAASNSPKNRLKNNSRNHYEQSREARNNLENKSNHAQRVVAKDEMMNRIRAKIKDHRPRGEGGEEMMGRARGEGSTGRESTPEPVPRRHSNHNRDKRPENNSWEEITPTTKPTAPVKTFYFGMNEEEINHSSGSGAGSEDNPEVERFAASIKRRVPHATSSSQRLPPLQHSSGSDSLSSDNNNEESGPTISLQLRPMLPRKQLEIPRFSPTAAWRLLSALESPVPSEDDDLVPLEDRIPVPLPHHSPDKSGDSGISGDASPHHQDSTHNSQAVWTPQQDLEETSSDGGLESAPLSPQSLPFAKFTPRFSLSLPRDDRLAVYTQSDKTKDEPESFQSLKRLRRSMSGALGRGKESVSLPQPLDNNWVLSRSVPNSLNNNSSLQLQPWSTSSPSPSSPDQEDDLSLVKQPSFSYLATGGHVMYLPEYSMPRSHRERHTTPPALSMSKSCEDLSQKHSEPQLAPSVMRAMEPSGRSGRKFTFQSTVRQIERRRIADRLSKEAEQKERQRLNELEAMRRVEEEFQRKREREKADIRHQLRLYSLTQGRAQPEGVDAPPPPSTQILSEFQQPRRDYRDFTPHRHGEEPVVEPRRSTVHPQVVCQMPKSTQVFIAPHLRSNSGSGVGSHEGNGGGMSTPRSSSSDNYRRHFAQGALPHAHSHSLVSSDSEMSQPLNSRPTSRNLHRSRSASPGRRSPPVVTVGEITLHLKQLKILQQSATVTPEPASLESTSLELATPEPASLESPSLELATPEPALLESTSLEPACVNQESDTSDVQQQQTSSIPPPPPPQPNMPVAPRLGLSALAQPFARSPKSFRPIAFNPSPNKLAQIAM